MDQIKNIIYKSYLLTIIPVVNSCLEIYYLIAENIRALANYLAFALAILIILLSLGLYNLVINCSKWILLGVASSIGFGFGMHTFVLFLAPHIAAVTMAGHSCGSLNFPEPPYPVKIICPDETDISEITFIKILMKIGLEAFMWGLGTAIGELPPYLAARLRARAMGRRAGGDTISGHPSREDTLGWEAWMIKIITRVGFIGILLCAAIPNPLFDAAGVASGTAQIPFRTFFGATLIGKAVIKVLLQSSFVILAFHKNNLEIIIKQLDGKIQELYPNFKKINLEQHVTLFLEEHRKSVIDKKMNQERQPSIAKSALDWIISLCFVLFIMSLINELDKKHRERKESKKLSSLKKD